MRLSFWGAAGTVTGSCYLLEVNNLRILVDCGMFQGSKALRERNYQPFGFNPGEISCVLLTHAHIDHSGLIPKLVKHGFKGAIYATSGTVDLCEVMLPDSGYIQEMDVERINRKSARAGRPLINPIYTMEDAQNSLQYFRRVQYGQEIVLSDEVRFNYLNAGHILGSGMIEIWVKENGQEKKFLFTGDLGRDNKAFIKDPDPVVQADYLIMESTYGNRLHEDSSNKLEILENTLWNTYRKGGNLVIPAFAVERTQDLLYDLNLLIQEKKFPPMEIYIDSPMAIAATEVFKKNHYLFDEETSQLIKDDKDPLNLPGLKYSITAEESIALNQQRSGAVIISASGMCDAGRIKHHLKHNLWRSECSILFVGYQAIGSKGRMLLDGAKSLRIHGEEVAVKADIYQIEGYSSHADQSELLKWVSNFQKPPQQTFLVHGDPESAQALGDLLQEKFAFPILIPTWQEQVEIEFAETLIKNEDLQKAHAEVARKLEAALAEGKDLDCCNIMAALQQLEKLLA